MSTAVIFDDVELLLTTRLREAGLTGYIGTEFPTSSTHPTVVRVMREGGRRAGPITDKARVGVNVFAKTNKEVNDLALHVRALIESFGDVRPFGRVEGQGIGTIPSDTGYKQRYFIVDVDLIGKTF